MHGQGWPVEEMMKLFAVLIFAVILFALITVITSYLGPMMEEVCKQHPEWPWCQGTTTEEEYVLAMSSTTALTCAVNSVAKGEQWDGGFTFTENGETQTVNCNEFYENSASLQGESNGESLTATVSCEEAGTFTCDCSVKYGTTKTKLGEVQGDTQDEADENCVEMLEDNGYEEYYASIYAWIDNCEQNLECAVNNFQLPEDFDGLVGTVEEYINGYGDPSFLVYWQNFPVGEDEDWTSASAWYQSVGRMMLWGFCLTGALGPVMKWASAPVKTIVNTAGKKASNLVNWVTRAAKSGSSVADDIDDGTIWVYGALKGKVLADDISNFIAKLQVNNGIVGFFKSQATNVDDAFTLYAQAGKIPLDKMDGSYSKTLGKSRDN